VSLALQNGNEKRQPETAMEVAKTQGHEIDHKKVCTGSGNTSDVHISKFPNSFDLHRLSCFIILVPEMYLQLTQFKRKSEKCLKVL
jgi:hypothetical protein